MVRTNRLYLRRRLIAVVALVAGLLLYALFSGAFTPVPQMSSGSTAELRAEQALEQLAVRDETPVLGYERKLFGSGWGTINGCDTRNVILNRDLTNVVLGDADELGRADGNCLVLSGTLQDLYTGEMIDFTRSNSNAIQIDHVVALSNGWQSGMNTRDEAERKAFANDPLNLLAVDGPANMVKSDASADQWLPEHKAAHCLYVARQITIKLKYWLSVTLPEKSAMQRVLQKCPDERVLPY